MTGLLTLACPYCSSYATDDGRAMYYLVTVIMCLVPAAMVSGLVYWLRRAAKRAEEDRTS